MSRFDNIGLFWEDLPSSRKRGERELGPMPAIPETGWRPPAFLPDISRAPVISFDVETKDPELTDAGPGWARGNGHIVGISCAIPGNRWYFPMRHEVQSELNMDPETVLRWAKHMLGQPMPKVGANLIYDIGWLRAEGVEVKGRLCDVQFAEALLNESSKVSLKNSGRSTSHRARRPTCSKNGAWAIMAQDLRRGARTSTAHLSPLSARMVRLTQACH